MQWKEPNMGEICSLSSRCQRSRSSTLDQPEAFSGSFLEPDNDELQVQSRCNKSWTSCKPSEVKPVYLNNFIWS